MEIRYLGEVIDRRLYTIKHINNNTNKANRTPDLISRTASRAEHQA